MLIKPHSNGLFVFLIGYVNNIPTMQFLTGIPQTTLSKSYMISLTESAWESENTALWDIL